MMRGRLWKIGDRIFDLSRQGLIMGVLNVTPDSFSDGGNFSRWKGPWSTV
jgi:dihydropteroate synthase